MRQQFVLSVVKGALSGKEYVIDEPGKYLIGRADDCMIVIPEGLGGKDVSRHHCVIDFSPPITRIRDLGSRNGTFVNGCKIGQRAANQTPEQADLSACAYCRLVNADEIQVGQTVLRFGFCDSGIRVIRMEDNNRPVAKVQELETVAIAPLFGW